MKFIKRYWYFLIVALITAGLGVMVLLTSKKLEQTGPVAPTVPQVTPKAAEPACTLRFTIQVEPTTVDCTAGLSDTFEGSTLDTAKWTVFQASQNATIEVTNGKLRVVQPAEGVGRRVEVENNSVVRGDFVAEVDIPNVNSQDKNKGSGKLVVASKGTAGTRVVVKRVSRDGKDLVISTNKPNDDDDEPEQVTIARSASLRVKVERIGSTIKTYYKTDGDYKLLATYTSFTDEARLVLTTNSAKPAFPRTMAQYDNFAVTCPSQITPTPTPTGTPLPTATPTPTPTRTPTPTATPTPEPRSCNNGCSTNTDCRSGLVCVDGSCRNSSCTSETDCTCPVVTEPPRSSCNNSCTINTDCASGLVCVDGSCRNSSCTDETDCSCQVSQAQPTPKVPVSGTGPSVLGASIIAGGFLLLLLGLAL